MRMRAALFHELNAPLTIETVELDAPVGRDVLIRTVASGVCHSDLHHITGLLPTARHQILGHESAGVVEAVGEQVTYVAPGDHVTTCLSAFCGLCERCLGGQPALCLAPPGRGAALPRCHWGDRPVARSSQLGGFAEYMLVHENTTVKIPRDAPWPVAAILGCGLTTGLGAALRTAAVQPGATVAVFGAGGVGLGAVQGARLAGARRIVAIDLVQGKLDTALRLGATHTVHAAEEDPVARIREITGAGADFTFDCIGAKQVTEQAWAALRDGGTATVVGVVPGSVEISGRDFLSEKKLQGCRMGSNRFRIDIPHYLEFNDQGRLHLDAMVSRTVPLERVNEAFDALRDGSGVRTVLTFD
jgi:S-(hydroxymethyl)glutathione dehydrogenase/alcohol dehydrogenase